MTLTEVEQHISRNGPRVLREYGQRYYNGWAAGMRHAVAAVAVPVTVLVPVAAAEPVEAPVLPLGPTA
jgi:hypothetical protein